MIADGTTILVVSSSVPLTLSVFPCEFGQDTETENAIAQMKQRAKGGNNAEIERFGVPKKGSCLEERIHPCCV